jgi:hypothetical protein
MAAQNATSQQTRYPSFEWFHSFVNFPLPRTVLDMWIVILLYNSLVSSPFGHNNRISKRCFYLVHSVNGAVMFNVPQYCYCSKDKETQLETNEGKYVLFISAISAANISFEVN